MNWRRGRPTVNTRRAARQSLRDRWAQWWQARTAPAEEAEQAPAESDDDEIELDDDQASSGWWTWLAWGGAALCLGMAALIFLNISEVPRERELTVASKFNYYGIRRITEKQVLQASGVRYGTPLTSIDRDTVARSIERLPWVRQAEVEAQLPDRVVFRVVEYQPYALLAAEGKLYIVDRGGFVFKQADPDEAGDLPILTGFSATLSRDAHIQTARSELTAEQRRLREILRLIEAHASSELASRLPLSEVHWDPVLGATLVGARDGTEIRLNRALVAEPQRAFELVARLLRQAERDGEWLRYALFDDEMRPDRVVVRAERFAAVKPGGPGTTALPQTTDGARAVPPDPDDPHD
jgi:hypothetical protein